MSSDKDPFGGMSVEDELEALKGQGMTVGRATPAREPAPASPVNSREGCKKLEKRVKDLERIIDWNVRQGRIRNV